MYWLITICTELQAPTNYCSPCWYLDLLFLLPSNCLPTFIQLDRCKPRHLPWDSPHPSSHQGDSLGKIPLLQKRPIQHFANVSLVDGPAVPPDTGDVVAQKLNRGSLESPTSCWWGDESIRCDLLAPILIHVPNGATYLAQPHHPWRHFKQARCTRKARPTRDRSRNTVVPQRD